IALGYLRNPDDALDVVQETFVKAFEHAARWDSSSEVLPWLCRIAVNQSIDRYRRNRRRRASFSPMEEGDHHESLASSGISPERRAVSGQIGEKIGRALEHLPETQRAVFVLRHYEDMSLEEISSTLGLALGTVKSSLHRAVHRLRDRLSGLAGSVEGA
ncbi:MAG TPA: sigma-70 family RNA polymerase sigma factor, partial [Vicinamibacteria bacterium]